MTQLGIDLIKNAGDPSYRVVRGPDGHCTTQKIEGAWQQFLAWLVSLFSSSLDRATIEIKVDILSRAADELQEEQQRIRRDLSEMEDLSTADVETFLQGINKFQLLLEELNGVAKTAYQTWRVVNEAAPQGQDDPGMVEVRNRLNMLADDLLPQSYALTYRSFISEREPSLSAPFYRARDQFYVLTSRTITPADRKVAIKSGLAILRLEDASHFDLRRTDEDPFAEQFTRFIRDTIVFPTMKAVEKLKSENSREVLTHLEELEDLKQWAQEMHDGLQARGQADTRHAQALQTIVRDTTTTIGMAKAEIARELGSAKDAESVAASWKASAHSQLLAAVERTKATAEEMHVAAQRDLDALGSCPEVVRRAEDAKVALYHVPTRSQLAAETKAHFANEFEKVKSDPRYVNNIIEQCIAKIEGRERNRPAVERLQEDATSEVKKTGFAWALSTASSVMAQGAKAVASATTTVVSATASALSSPGLDPATIDLRQWNEAYERYRKSKLSNDEIRAAGVVFSAMHHALGIRSSLETGSTKRDLAAQDEAVKKVEATKSHIELLAQLERDVSVQPEALDGTKVEAVFNGLNGEELRLRHETYSTAALDAVSAAVHCRTVEGVVQELETSAAGA